MEQHAANEVGEQESGEQENEQNGEQESGHQENEQAGEQESGD